MSFPPKLNILIILNYTICDGIQMRILLNIQGYTYCIYHIQCST